MQRSAVSLPAAATRWLAVHLDELLGAPSKAATGMSLGLAALSDGKANTARQRTSSLREQRGSMLPNSRILGHTAALESQLQQLCWLHAAAVSLHRSAQYHPGCWGEGGTIGGEEESSATT